MINPYVWANIHVYVCVCVGWVYMFEIFRPDGTGGNPELMHNHVISVF